MLYWTTIAVLLELRSGGTPATRFFLKRKEEDVEGNLKEISVTGDYPISSSVPSLMKPEDCRRCKHFAEKQLCQEKWLIRLFEEGNIRKDCKKEIRKFFLR